jgi:hypothetical protein
VGAVFALLISAFTIVAAVFMSALTCPRICSGGTLFRPVGT